MREIFLNGRQMKNKDQLHDYLKEKLELPDYYGKNLDALWDLLTTDDRERKIIFVYAADFSSNLGDYGHSLLALLKEAAQENDKLNLEIRG